MDRRLGEFQSLAATRFGRKSQPVLGIELQFCCVAKVEGIMLKAAWHWGSDGNVVNYPLGEPDSTPLYVGLLSVWGSADGDHMLFPHFVGGLINWVFWQIYVYE